MPRLRCRNTSLRNSAPTPFGVTSAEFGRWPSVSAIRPASIGVAPPPWEKMKRMSGFLIDGAVDDQARDGARRIERKLDGLRNHSRQHTAAARRHGRMNVNDGLAPIEFGKDRRERRIAEIFAVVGAHQADAVGLERVEGVFDFLEAAVGIGQRDRREQSVAAGKSLDLLGGIIAPHPRRAACLLGVAEPHAGRRLRHDGGRNAVRVHDFEGLTRRPRHHLVRRYGAVSEADALMLFFHVLRRQEVMVDVDAFGRWLGRGGLREYARRGKRRCGGGRHSGRKKLAAADAAAT